MSSSKKKNDSDIFGKTQLEKIFSNNSGILENGELVKIGGEKFTGDNKIQNRNKYIKKILKSVSFTGIYLTPELKEYINKVSESNESIARMNKEHNIVQDLESGKPELMSTPVRNVPKIVPKAPDPDTGNVQRKPPVITLVEKDESDISSGIKSTQAAAEVAAQASEPEATPELTPVEKTPYQRYEDDLNQVLISKKYSVSEQINTKRTFLDSTEEEIVDFLIKAKASDFPIVLEDSLSTVPVELPGTLPILPISQDPEPEPLDIEYITEPGVTIFTGIASEDPETLQVLDEETQAQQEVIPDTEEVITDQTVPDVETSAESLVTNETVPEPVEDQTQTLGTEVTPEVIPQLQGSGSLKFPFVKRYHEFSLTTFFQNSSYPQWDKVLESNILASDLSEDERIRVMDDIIDVYGKIIHVRARKSSTVEELVELMELQFCEIRNLQLGDRFRTANVKLSQLAALESAVGSQNGLKGLSEQPQQEPVTGSETTSSSSPKFIEQVPSAEPDTGSGVTNVATEAESKFDENHDRHQHLTNLSRIVYMPRRKVPQASKPRHDPHTLGII